MGLVWLAAACSDSGDGSSSTEAPTPSPTEAPRDIPAAQVALEQFARAVQEDRLDDAWHLYAASIPGTTNEHRPDRGCDYSVFSFEFPMMRNLFQELSPLQVVETFGSALGVNVVELRVRGANGLEYLATLPRGEPYSEDYQLQFLNSGNPAAVPGVPAPFPSPQYPQGFCGIWTGAR
jgi:hypothetical protein